MDSTPDTGCTITLLNLDVALRNSIHIDQTKTVELYHAAGGSMHIEGMANIYLPVGQQHPSNATSCCEQRAKRKMIISCEDLRKLRVIPADFPNTVFTVKAKNQLVALRTKIFRKFDKTLSDELNPKPMRCPPMSISLQDDAIPICVTTARRVPKHYEPEFKKTITELLE